MIEAGPGDGEKDPLAAPTQPRHDFSAVQGFQVVAEHHAAGQNEGDEQGWRDSLRLEMETRAARFRQAVDSAIVLSNDGVIRWLGDPVARLSPGPTVLAPGAVILADEALPDAARDVVKARIELWLAATTRRILGPLFALDGLQEGSEVVRDLAGKLARSLGILDRDPIRAQLKSLAQSDRAELRKLGVRFGAYYVFAPTLIKPAARILALQLWSLRAPGDAGGLLGALAQAASSGRTSLLINKEISREGYRVAGYRPCGERAVRVDVIERLAGIIRGAIVENRARAAPGSVEYEKANGFVVSGQMTSLTGCAGEQFASILRSIGFRSVEMKRSEFVGSPPVVESPREPAPISQIETTEIASEGEGSPAVGDETEAVDAVFVAPEATSGDATPLEAGQPDIAPDGLSSNGSRPAPVAPPDVPSVPSGLAPTAEADKNAELIIVWRPDRSAFARREAGGRARREHGRAPNGEQRATIGPLDRPDNASRRPAAAEARQTRHERREARSNPAAADRRRAAAQPPGSGGQRGSVPVDEKHRQTSSDRDNPRPRPASEREAKADPNSPFAKLLALKSLLEEQANKRP